MSSRVEVGDVVKMYKLRTRELGPIGAASPSEPAWFLIEWIPQIGGKIYGWPLSLSHKNPRVDQHTAVKWAIADSHQARNELGDGHYHVVPPERWPDEISAAVMARQLTKGDD